MKMLYSFVSILKFILIFLRVKKLGWNIIELTRSFLIVVGTNVAYENDPLEFLPYESLRMSN